MKGFLQFAAAVAEGQLKPAKNPKKHPGTSSREYDEQVKKAIPSDVRLFSGCMDSQTSADVSNISSFGLPANAGPGGAGGACTNALLASLQKNPNPTYVKLLESMREILAEKRYTQVPQLSASRPLDLTIPFSLENPTGQGKKRAVMIGINYRGMSPGELHGCINDVESMRRFITTKGFRDVKILTDDTPEKPTRANILRALSWLVEGAQPGDSLFLHYSGHGGQVPDTDGDEADGYDETIIPLDFKSAGQILDDDLFKLLVAPLPAGCQLTAVMDCCHSGTVLDLPYEITGNASTMNAIAAGQPPTMNANPQFNLASVMKIALAVYQTYKATGDLKQCGLTAVGAFMSGDQESGGGGGGGMGDVLGGLLGGFGKKH